MQVAKEYSISEISAQIQSMVEINFDHVILRGEISGLKKATSGHMYFSLKDAQGAVLNAICWKTTASKLSIAPEEGMDVKVVGRITTYPQRSNYQIIVSNMQPYGEGALLQLLEQRKQALTKEGLFDLERKLSIPKFAQTIGIITSPTGAVIHDILHRLKERFPSHILLFPTAVQGDNAAKQIQHAITFFNDLDAHGSVPRPDLLIVARGGGSLEDLWCFNDEDLVRSTAQSRIPIISAVGHETDTTLIDYASSKRAPTPTAAAEMALPLRADLLTQLQQQKQSLLHYQQQQLNQLNERLDNLHLRLPKPSRLLEQPIQRLDWLEMRMQSMTLFQRQTQQLSILQHRLPSPLSKIINKQQSLGQLASFIRNPLQIIARKQEQLRLIQGVLHASSHERILEKGYVMAQDGKGNILSHKSQLPETAFNLHFRDGVQKVVKYPATARPKKRKEKDQPELPDLFS